VVSFGEVHVHRHRLTLGDNPGVSSGIPLQLGWEEESSELVDVEAFEKRHSDRSVTRIAKSRREAIASEHHTRDSIVRVQEEVREIQHSVQDSERDGMIQRPPRSIAKKKKKKGGGFRKWLSDLRKYY
jgi:hypothetical protein